MLPLEILSEIERLPEVVRQQQQQIQSQQEIIERLENQVTQQGERIQNGVSPLYSKWLKSLCWKHSSHSRQLSSVNQQ
jgi:hypothetical protein